MSADGLQQLLDTARAERDRAIRALLVEQSRPRLNLDACQDRDRLKGLLRVYGRHLPSCPVEDRGSTKDRCDCGWTDVAWTEWSEGQ